jgi:hypothetical protein
MELKTSYPVIEIMFGLAYAIIKRGEGSRIAGGA